MEPAKRVLVVDDDVNHASTIADILGSIGLDVDVANSGPDALGLARIKRYDYALLDIRMPGMNGVELLERMRRERCDPPETIMMTAYSQNDLTRAARHEGAAAVLEKPLDLPFLIKYFSGEITLDQGFARAANSGGIDALK
jgi:CheY-like chemotaxis protein